MKTKFEFICLMVLLLIATSTHFAFAKCTNNAGVTTLCPPPSIEPTGTISPTVNTLSCPSGYQLFSSRASDLSCYCCVPLSQSPSAIQPSPLQYTCTTNNANACSGGTCPQGQRCVSLTLSNGSCACIPNTTILLPPSSSYPYLPPSSSYSKKPALKARTIEREKEQAPTDCIYNSDCASGNCNDGKCE